MSKEEEQRALGDLAGRSLCNHTQPSGRAGVPVHGNEGRSRSLPLSEYLLAQGTVELAQLPQRFSWLPSRDVYRRIQQLEAEGRVSGVFDSERGRYVFISETKFRQIADFINERGRVRCPGCRR